MTRKRHETNQSCKALAIIDAVVSNTPTFVRLSQNPNGKLRGSVVLNNVKLTNVPAAIAVNGGPTLLNGGTTTIDSWAMGNVYHGTNGSPTYTQGTIPSIKKASNLLDGSGRIFQKTHPQYIDYAPSDFVSVRSHGAKGDGKTDDTQAIQNVLNQVSGLRLFARRRR